MTYRSDCDCLALWYEYEDRKREYRFAPTPRTAAGVEKARLRYVWGVEKCKGQKQVSVWDGSQDELEL